MSRGHSSSTTEMSVWQGPEASCQQPASPCQPHGRAPESTFSSPSQAFRWSQPQPAFWLQPHQRPWARTTQLSGYWIPDPQKQWDSKYLLFYVTSFWCNILCSHRSLIWPSKCTIMSVSTGNWFCPSQEALSVSQMDGLLLSRISVTPDSKISCLEIQRQKAAFLLLLF